MIGEMDQVVSVFTAEYTPDGIGGTEKTLVDLGQYWAKVTHLSGDEREHAQRNADKISVSFKMHNFEGFPASTTSQISWNGSMYDVVDREFDGNQRLYVVFKTVSGEYLG